MKVLYIVLGFIFLGLGVVGVILPLIPSTPFFLLTLFFFTKGSDRLHNWFLQTDLYKKHLKTFKEQGAMTQKSKISILTLATIMLSIGFYFTPSTVGRCVIVTVLVIKYWVFFYKIKTIE